jgi:hypothetical protein
VNETLLDGALRLTLAVSKPIVEAFSLGTSFVNLMHCSFVNLMHCSRTAKAQRIRFL